MDGERHGERHRPAGQERGGQRPDAPGGVHPVQLGASRPPLEHGPVRVHGDVHGGVEGADDREAEEQRHRARGRARDPQRGAQRHARRHGEVPAADAADGATGERAGHEGAERQAEQDHAEPGVGEVQAVLALGDPREEARRAEPVGDEGGGERRRLPAHPLRMVDAPPPRRGRGGRWPPTGSGATFPPVAGQRIGLCFGTVLTATLPELVAAASGAGFDAVTVSPHLVDRARAAGLDDRGVRALLDDAGLAVTEVDPLLTWIPGHDARHLGDEPPLVWFAYDPDAYFDTAELVGAATVNVAQGGEVSGVQQIVDGLGATGSRAAEHGLRVCYEFLPWSATPDLASACEAVAAVGLDNVGVLLDVWHFFRSGGRPDDLTPERLDRVTALQVNDAPGRAGGRPRRRVDGRPPDARRGSHPPRRDPGPRAGAPARPGTDRRGLPRRPRGQAHADVAARAAAGLRGVLGR